MEIRAGPSGEAGACATGDDPARTLPPGTPERMPSIVEPKTDGGDAKCMSATCSAGSSAPEPRVQIAVSVGISQRVLKGEDRSGSLATSINVPWPQSMCLP